MVKAEYKESRPSEEFCFSLKVPEPSVLWAWTDHGVSVVNIELSEKS